MEPSGRNQWQPVAMVGPRKPLKQADPQPVATQGNRFGAHGKEGVEPAQPQLSVLMVPKMVPKTPYSTSPGAP